MALSGVVHMSLLTFLLHCPFLPRGLGGSRRPAIAMDAPLQVATQVDMTQAGEQRQYQLEQGRGKREIHQAKHHEKIQGAVVSSAHVRDAQQATVCHCGSSP